MCDELPAYQGAGCSHARSLGIRRRCVEFHFTAASPTWRRGTGNEKWEQSEGLFSKKKKKRRKRAYFRSRSVVCVPLCRLLSLPVICHWASRLSRASTLRVLPQLSATVSFAFVWDSNKRQRVLALSLLVCTPYLCSVCWQVRLGRSGSLLRSPAHTVKRGPRRTGISCT